MTPYKQLNRHDPANGVYGDCARTAIACLLDVPPQDVPHFMDGCDNDEQADVAIDAQQAWLGSRGLAVVTLGYGGYGPDDPPSAILDVMAESNPGIYYLLVGRSQSGVNHVVVCCGGEIVHDPSLDDAGIVGPTLSGAYIVEVLVSTRFTEGRLW